MLKNVNVKIKVQEIEVYSERRFIHTYFHYSKSKFPFYLMTIDRRRSTKVVTSFLSCINLVTKQNNGTG